MRSHQATSCLEWLCSKASRSLQETGMSDPRRKAWWNVSDSVHSPLMFSTEEDQEDYILGPEDQYLRTLEVHSNSLIQLESWFTASGQTRVTVVGAFNARLWVRDMIRKGGSKNTFDQTKGEIMLQRIQSRPLMEQDLEFHSEARSRLWFQD